MSSLVDTKQGRRKEKVRQVGWMYQYTRTYVSMYVCTYPWTVYTDGHVNYLLPKSGSAGGHQTGKEEIEGETGRVDICTNTHVRM